MWVTRTKCVGCASCELCVCADKSIARREGHSREGRSREGACTFDNVWFRNGSFSKMFGFGMVPSRIMRVILAQGPC